MTSSTEYTSFVKFFFSKDVQTPPSGYLRNSAKCFKIALTVPDELCSVYTNFPPFGSVSAWNVGRFSRRNLALWSTLQNSQSIQTTIFCLMKMFSLSFFSPSFYKTKWNGQIYWRAVLWFVGSLLHKILHMWDPTALVILPKTQGEQFVSQAVCSDTGASRCLGSV